MNCVLIGAKTGDTTYFDDSQELMQHQPVRVRLIKIFYSDVVLGL